METINANINHEEILFFGNPNGHYKSGDRIVSKFNRTAKLAQNYNELISKFKSFIVSGTKSKRKNCAYACLLMFYSGIRVGNEASAEGYTTKVKGLEGQQVQTFGLTTLKPEHVMFEEICDADDDTRVYKTMYLDFVGKKSVKQYITISDPFLIEWGEFFYKQNKEKETWLDISSYEITKFVKKYIGRKFVPKDLRTVKANLEAYKIHRDILTRPLPQKKSEVNKETKEIVERTSEYLGNTPQICKRAYIDNRLLNYHIKQRYTK
jgi:DNA topoisomerase IB